MTAAETPDAIEGAGDVGRLRRAAEMLRTRAEVGAPKNYPAPWIVESETITGHGDDWEIHHVRSEGGDGDLVDNVAEDVAAYIAMMSLPVALALAVWLDYTASIASPEDDEFRDDGCECPYCVGIPLATKVANAILGDTP